MDITVYAGSTEWSALYADGKLHTVGDHYLIDDALRELLGVKTIQSDDFMRGGNHYKNVAQTLTEIREWQDKTQKEVATLLREKASLVRVVDGNGVASWKTTEEFLKEKDWVLDLGSQLTLITHDGKEAIFYL